MADEIAFPENSGSRFKPHPEGQYAAVCVDSINLGERVERYMNNPERIVQKCAVVFRTGEVNAETGDPHEVSAEFTISTSEKAGLRKFLENWRGKSYADEDEMRAKGQIHKLVGHGALITVEHKLSGGGRTYAKLKTITQLPKGMTKPDAGQYERPDFWKQRKEEYNAEAQKFKALHAPNDEDAFAMANGGDDDDLPFSSGWRP